MPEQQPDDLAPDCGQLVDDDPYPCAVVGAHITHDNGRGTTWTITGPNGRPVQREQQPDDLVTALAREMALTGLAEEWITDGLIDTFRPYARAVLARTDLVLPAVDVVPRAEHERALGLLDHHERRHREDLREKLDLYAERDRFRRAVLDLAAQIDWGTVGHIDEFVSGERAIADRLRALAGCVVTGQQPDTVTELAKVIAAAERQPVGDPTHRRNAVASTVLAWVEERHVPRAEYDRVDREHWAALAELQALRQGALALAAEWTRYADADGRCAAELRALVGGAS